MDIIVGILLIALYVLFVVVLPLAICIILLVAFSWQVAHSKKSKRRSLFLLGILVVLAVLIGIVWYDLHVAS